MIDNDTQLHQAQADTQSYEDSWKARAKPIQV